MSKKRLIAIFASLLLFTFPAQTFSQKTFSQKSEQLIPETDVQLSPTDRFVMHVLRTINSAETTYTATIGAGNYGNLNELLTADLIDEGIASGEKYGYYFMLSPRFATATIPPGFELKAIPVLRKPRRLSFYMNENCEIRGADKLGREATIDDPVIEPCNASPRSENEKAVRLSMRTIHGAEMTYAATFGNGQYGTLAQLYDVNLVRTGFALVYIYHGYVSTMNVTQSTPNSPARFTLSVVPLEYGRSGTNSFYIDETGVLRARTNKAAPQTKTIRRLTTKF